MIQEYESKLIKKNNELNISFCRGIVLKRFDAASIGILLRRLMYDDHDAVFQHLHANRMQAIMLREMLPKGVFTHVVNHRWEEKVESVIDNHSMIVSNAYATNRPFLRHRVFQSYTLARYTEWFNAYALVPNIVSVFNIQHDVVDISFDDGKPLKRVMSLLPIEKKETFAMAVMLQLTMAVYQSQIVNTGKIHQYRYLSPEFLFFSKDGLVRLPIPNDESPSSIIDQSHYILSSPFLAPERRMNVEDFLEVLEPVNASVMWSIGVIALSIALGMDLCTKNYSMRLKYQKMMDHASSDLNTCTPFFEIVRRCLLYNPYDRIRPQEALAMMFATKSSVWYTAETVDVTTLEKEMSYGRNTFYKGPLEWKEFIQTTMCRNKKSRRFIRKTLNSL